MSSKVDFFLNKTLGEDFLESLSKSEIWKPGTKSVNDIEDMRIGLKIVPRVIMTFLIRELAPMTIGENKEVAIPGVDSAILQVTKFERDQYSGQITQHNKKVTEFKFRSIPSLGIVLMSAFELYQVDELHREPTSEDASAKIQRMIDERLALHDLIGKVVDKKIMEREAVHQLVLTKLTETLKAMEGQQKTAEKIADITKIAHQSANSGEYFRGMANGMEVADCIANEKEPNFVPAPPQKKVRPLQEFLEKRQKKTEFSVVMAKGETVTCPDCGKNIFDGTAFSGCVCLGDDMEKKVFIKKSEDGIKVRFGKGWDKENIEMLLETLRKKHE
jgi:hypothetical protein